VIGVQVADQHLADQPVVDDRAQLREHAVAAVEQELQLSLLYEIATARSGGVLPRW